MIRIALPKHKAELSITHNTHKNYYETAQQYTESRLLGMSGETPEDRWVSPEQQAKAYETDELWEVQVYPDTPVGFYVVWAADLDAALLSIAEIEGIEMEMVELPLLTEYMRQKDLLKPLNLVLHCPNCREPHIDTPTAGWDNPPHATHLCANCGQKWRPCWYPTNGVPYETTHNMGMAVDANGCFTRPDGSCGSTGPCMHTPTPEQIEQDRLEKVEEQIAYWREFERGRTHYAYGWSGIQPTEYNSPEAKAYREGFDHERKVRPHAYDSGARR